MSSIYTNVNFTHKSIPQATVSTFVCFIFLYFWTPLYPNYICWLECKSQGIPFWNVFSYSTFSIYKLEIKFLRRRYLMDKRCPIYLVINQRKKRNFGLVSISWGIPRNIWKKKSWNFLCTKVLRYFICIARSTAK